MCARSPDRVRLYATPWTIAHQAPLSMTFSRQKYWSGCHALFQEIFLTQGSSPGLICLLHWQVFYVSYIESSRKTSVSALLTMPKPLTMWITTNCGKFFKRWEYHLTCLLRNLYSGQEATVRTGHGTTNWFQIGKGIHQGCMRNTGLDEAQAGIKTAGRNINYL